MTTTTLVSSLVYINDARPRLRNKHQGCYQRWAPNVLSLASPLVFQVDDHYHHAMRSCRSVHDPGLAKTRFKKVSLPDLHAYREYFAAVQTLMTSPAFIGRIRDPNGLQWTQPLYNIVTFDKIHLLQEVATLNPFHTDYFCWIDAGGIRHRIEPGLLWPGAMHALDPNRVNIFCVTKPRILEEREWMNHSLSHAAMIQAAALVSQKGPLDEFVPLFSEVIRRCLAMGFIGAEQKMLDICYSLRPELFHVIDATSHPSKQENIWFKFFDFLL